LLYTEEIGVFYISRNTGVGIQRMFSRNTGVGIRGMFSRNTGVGIQRVVLSKYDILQNYICRNTVQRASVVPNRKHEKEKDIYLYIWTVKERQ